MNHCNALVTALLALALLAAGPATSAPATTPLQAVGDAVAGKKKSLDERCQECHGFDGNSNDIGDGVANEGKFPKLAGQHVDYIVKQVRDFRSGVRHNDTMAVMARSVAEEDVRDIAVYFSSQTRQRERSGGNPVGKALFENGDGGRAIPPCAGCHGEHGEGLAAAGNPAIGGQHKRYLKTQLFEWKSGDRGNSPGGIMNSIAKALADGEIEALADYVSGL